MTQTVVTVPEIDAARTTDDGRMMQIKAIQVSGEEFIVEIPHATLPGLISLSALCLAQGAARQGVPGDLRITFDVVNCKVEQVADSTARVLTVTLGNGGSLSFLLPANLISELVSGLGA